MNDTNYKVESIGVIGLGGVGGFFGGTVIRLGESLGIPTPETRSVYASIQSRL